MLLLLSWLIRVRKLFSVVCQLVYVCDWYVDRCTPTDNQWEHVRERVCLSETADGYLTVGAVPVVLMNWTRAPLSNDARPRRATAQAGTRAPTTLAAVCRSPLHTHTHAHTEERMKKRRMLLLVLAVRYLLLLLLLLFVSRSHAARAATIQKGLRLSHRTFNKLRCFQCIYMRR